MRILISALTLLLASVGFASWGIDISTGTSGHLPNKLTLVQEPDLNKTIRGTWETKPWVGWSPLSENYYTVRIRYDVFELELVHDKVHFTGSDPNIQHYEISDGLNYLLINYAPVIASGDSWEVLGRVGLGISIPNPTTTINGEKDGHHGHWRGNRYYFGGLAAQVGVQGKYWITDWFGLSADGKYTFAEVRAPIANGHSYAFFNGFHVGFGVSFKIP